MNLRPLPLPPFTGGLFAFAIFFFVLASLLGRIDTAAAFVCATAAAVLMQALSYSHGTERNVSTSIEPRGVSRCG